MDLPVMPPVRPILAKSVKSGVPLPDTVNGGLLYEPKWDESDRLIFSGSSGI